MPTLKLHARAIPSLKPRADGKREVYRDAVVPGLYLEVHPTGRRVFGVWFRANGRAGRLTLGPWTPGVFDLADARDAAREALHQSRKGTDPSAAKRQQRDAGDVGGLVETFLISIKDHIRPTTHYGWALLLRHERLAGLRTMKPHEVQRGDIVRLLDRIASTAPYSANRTFEALRRMFRWGVEKDLIQASPIVGIRPPTKETQRQRSYTDDELRAIIAALAGEGKMGDAIKLCVYTGVRIRQALAATWREFDLDAGKTWTIPAERAGTKNALPWLTPLSEPAVTLLARLKDEANGSEFVFPVRRRVGTGEGPSWRQQRVVENICKASGVADFRPHDLRRTLSTWLAAQKVPKEVRDAVLQHVPPRLERTYNLHDYLPEKRRAFERWARHVERIMAEGDEQKVLPLART
jgi:integrase